MGCIYGHRNKITGDEYYIGQTSVNYEFANVYRWKNGAGYTYSNTYFGNIIKQIGWENIEHFCIADNVDSQEELDRLEIENIKKYRSYIGFKDCKGYNMTLGGKNTVTGLEWSEEEKILLILNYPSLGPACFKLFKNRTEKAIRSMAKCLGLKMINRPTGNFYTDEELKIMYDFYPTEGTKVVKRLHNRTTKAIKRLARALGIKCNFAKVPTIKWTEENKNRLKELYPLMGTKCYEILNCSPIAVAQMASKLKLHAPNKDFTPEEIKIIEENCNKLSYAELAQLLPGRTVTGIKSYINVTLNKTPKKDKQKNIRLNIIKLAQEGNTLKEIKKALNVSFPTIIDVCKKNNIILTKEKRVAYNQRAVLCIETNIKYNSIAEAKRITGIKSIDQAVLGKIQTAGGYHWKYID